VIRSRAAVFYPTDRPLTADEAAMLVGVDASVYLHGVE
jgi:hypothetical protein